MSAPSAHEQKVKKAQEAETVSALEEPERAGALAQAILNPDVSEPEPPTPSDTMVYLPGGLVRGNEVIRNAEVRELTGEHEEALARAAQAAPSNLFHFTNVLLECGTVRFGSEDPADTRKLLRDLLVGDRDALILGIRRATYGDEIKIEEWTCPQCQKLSDLTVPLADIPVRDLKDPQKEMVFEVTLRRGRMAEVRLATGADQTAVFEQRDLSVAERDTLLIGRCLMGLTDANGTKHHVVGMSNTEARKMSVPDRHAILDQLRTRQPGPQLNEMKLTHDACGNEVELLIGIGDLFRGLSVV